MRSWVTGSGMRVHESKTVDTGGDQVEIYQHSDQEIIHVVFREKDAPDGEHVHLTFDVPTMQELLHELNEHKHELKRRLEQEAAE